MYAANRCLQTFSTDYCVKIYYKMSLFFLIWILCKKMIKDYCKQPKLLYRESTSVTSMHEKNKTKTGSIQKKARCKIFTNRYKNINMNKLISSTFLYCAPIYPSPFSNNWKRNLATVEKAPLYPRQRSPFIRRCVSFTTLHYSESDPALQPCHQKV